MKVTKYTVGDRVILHGWHGRTKARTGTVVSFVGGNVIVQRDGLRGRERWSTYFWRKVPKTTKRRSAKGGGPGA